MDVRCERCRAQYVFDDDQVTPAGLTVQCTNCGHVFKVKKKELVVTVPVKPEELEGAPIPATGLMRELLERRSRLPVSDQTPSVAAPGIPPGKGHEPARFATGYGVENRRHFIQVDFGPGYHDLFDPEGGYTRGAQINVLHTALRYYPEHGTVELERLDVVDFTSLTSWGHFLRPASWKANVGVVRKQLADKDRQLMGRFNSGIGISHDFSENVSTHIFAEGTVEASDHFSYGLAPGIPALSPGQAR